MTFFPRFAARYAAAVVLAAACALAPAVELTMYANPIEGPFVRRVVESWSEKTGHTVRILMAPASSSGALALYQQQLAAGTSDVDLYQIDSVWPGLLGKHFVDLRPYAGGVEELHIKSSIDNTLVGGRLVSLPLYLDAGMMYYRTDLLDRHGKPVRRAGANWPPPPATSSRRSAGAATAGCGGWCSRGAPTKGSPAWRLNGSPRPAAEPSSTPTAP